MTYVHPNLSENYGSAFDLGDLTHRLNDASDHLQLAPTLYDATALPPIELRRVMRAMARREGAASWESAHELVVRRLRAFLQLNMEDARVAARAFADAHIDLPHEWRERSREVEFDVIKNALHMREFIALTHILPWLKDEDAGDWLADHLPEADAADLAFDASGTPALSTGS
ncbi:MAG: hypothetical protein OXG42_08860 [Chloroflexi bacterium]|nr:hypothetical protein [Chloroflexota bacterium]